MSDWKALSAEGRFHFAQNLAAQRRELFRHLPAAEVADDEPLVFRTDCDGRLIIGVPATGASYGLRAGVGWRVREVAAGSYEVTVWEWGELCRLYLVPLEEVMAQWN